MRNVSRRRALIAIVAGVASASANAGAYEDYFRAVVNDNASTVAELLRRGFDVNTVDEKGQPGLVLAMRDGSFKVAELLLAHPQIEIGLQLIVPLMVALAGIVLFLVRLAVQSQLRRSVTGSAGMINEAGEALTPIPAGGSGRVATHGEIWNATSDEDIGQGDRVRVVSVDGLDVRVRRVSSDAPGGSP